MNIYVGNLPYSSSEAELRQMFEAHGRVDSTRIIIDKLTNKSKGFAFIEMPNSSEAQAAIAALDGQQLDGRALRINEARPKTDFRAGGDRGGDRGRDHGGDRGAYRGSR